MLKILSEAEIISANLPPLLIRANRTASTFSHGFHGRRRVGQGETFWQFRRYANGDSGGLIDWRQSGKSQHVFVRETEWEAAQVVWLWCDRSGSMNFSSSLNLSLKIQRADLLLLAISTLFVRGGERIAFIGSSMRPSSSKKMLIENYNKAKKDALPNMNIPKKQSVSQYSHTLWFSDFLGPLDELKKIIRYYSSQGVKGCLVQILDVAEKNPPYNGRVIFGGMERGDPDILVRHAGSLRQKYKKIICSHNEELEEVAKSFGWNFISHTTSEPPEPVLKKLFLYFSNLDDR